MFLRTEKIPERKLVGKSLKMSFATDQTPVLWKAFMTNRKAIKNVVSPDKYSLQIYDPSVSFKNFTPHTEFTKWAAIEVSEFPGSLPEFENLTLESGLYAVFLHRGTVGDFAKTWQYIFSQWLPNSTYKLDQRPHFELLTEKYKHNDPTSEEEVWIPIC